ncbi:uncharacterized protein LOC111643887 [Copidosoma floridanum]|uniref:uncharacterized protein LOC111643887 n=1 Tax=Copidosoma floridanum TaxID=29053 RepID=UPI000C6F67A4|nr:uncharacterized protein LOC111643887 [Copidosoma floridanum]
MDGYGGNYRGAGSHVHTTAMYLQLGDFLNLCYPPPMILLGFLGNLLSGLVFMSKQMRVRSSSYYLAALAFADIGFLSWFLINWLNFYLSLRVFDWPGFCEVAIYIRSVCVSLSAWLKVAFTVERFVAVLYPLHRPQICTARRAQHIVLTLVALALVSHSYCIVTLNPVNFDPWITMCKTKNNYLKTMYIVNIVNDLVNLVGPIVLVAVMNTCIWLKFSRSGKPFAYGHQQQNLELQSQPQQMPQGSQIYNIPKSVSSTTPVWLSAIIAMCSCRCFWETFFSILTILFITVLVLMLVCNKDDTCGADEHFHETRHKILRFFHIHDYERPISGFIDKLSNEADKFINNLKKPVTNDYR